MKEYINSKLTGTKHLSIYVCALCVGAPEYTCHLCTIAVYLKDIYLYINLTPANSRTREVTHKICFQPLVQAIYFFLKCKGRSLPWKKERAQCFIYRYHV